MGNLREMVLKGEWYQVFDIIEYLIRYYEFSSVEDKKAFAEVINGVLTECKTGYRVVGEYIAPITNEEEIRAIEEAIRTSPDPVSQHLQQALAHLADRENPQYKDSIHDAILAVEAQCNLILGKTNDALGDLLSRLHHLPPALREAFKKLYGFTSGPYGIRHALAVEGVDIGFDEAKLMLVLCSAFVNYVRAKQNEIQQPDEG